MAKAQSQHASTSRRSLTRVHWQSIAILVFAAVFLYLIIPHLGSLHQSLSVVRHAQIDWLVLALLAALGTYPAAAGVYQCLAKHRLRYLQTVSVQLAGTFVNRVLPAGLGALSVNFDYLRKRHHKSVEAGSVIAMNNLIGLIGNILLLGSVLLLKPMPIRGISMPHSRLLYIVAAIVVAVAVAVVVWSRKWRDDLYKTLRGLQRNILNYRAQPGRIVGALVISMSLTLLNTACLAACGRALGVHLTITQLLVIMTAGVAVGTITPTPGGLFGAEAGLFAGLTAYAIPAAPALAVVLLYRLFTYWVPLIFGAPALVFARRSGYL
jgi:uncharacterized membrane protein YbhN (UPF0104 family)